MVKDGNILKRKDSRWEARYTKRYELSGKIKHGFCYGKTYAEAKEKAFHAKTALANGKPIPGTGNRNRFDFYCDSWLTGCICRLKESTHIKYEGLLKKHTKTNQTSVVGITHGVLLFCVCKDALNRFLALVV